ncbi:hypothetical protein [Cohnella zeiphila]|uniref:Transcriptional regulator n=1 Tax=Cohnella zeiphila TaxID=2761120 RepID=A0A7X0SSH8_9BACL|nr:hypothetical protein [Cohnella zeiphila]MBB6735161.1 hypothetical protein [Cohnella zeiphila]
MLTERRPHRTEPSGIRIAVIGPEEVMPMMIRCLKRFPSFLPSIRSYRRVAEAPQLAGFASEEADLLLFTGEIPYRLARARVHFRVPALFVPLTGSGLNRCLLRLERSCGLSALSADTLPRSAVEAALEGLGGDPIELAVYEGCANPSASELIAYHRDQYRSGRSRCALTALKSVAGQLAEEGIPVEWIVPSEQDIIVTLERALLSTEWRRNKEAQFVIGYIRVERLSRSADRGAPERTADRLRLPIHSILLDFAELLEGSLTPLAGDEYLLVTSRGILERETAGYKRLPLAKQALIEAGAALSIGIGFGCSAGEAETRARQSLFLAKEGGGNACYIVREDESVIGPLEMTEPMELGLALVDAALVKKAGEVGLTTLYLSKLIGHTTRYGRIDYYARDLASVLGVTVRSAHRFLLTWTDAGLVEVVGEEKGASRGRPRQKYRMSFLDDLIC